MPRQPRYFVAGYPQHVVIRGVNRQAMFFRDVDYDRFEDVLRRALLANACRLHAYVLMTNHVHFLMTPDHELSIPRTVQSLGRGYVQVFNRIHSRTGALWESRYKACIVQDDQYLLTCQRYIELNPVRAGMVKQAGDYRRSSHLHNAYGWTNPLISEHRTYTGLADCPRKRRAVYRRLFVAALDERELSEIRMVTNACRVLGNDEFKGKLGSDPKASCTETVRFDP